MTEPAFVIKKRSRPQQRIRQVSIEREEEETPTPENEEEEANLPVADLIELRKLRRAREGIDVAKLNKGDAKRRRKRAREGEQEEEGVKAGLRKGAPVDDDGEEENKEAKARRVVRANNFTQQTNVMDVDKHMMAYIEENLKVRSRPKDDEDDEDEGPADPQEALYRIVDKFKANKETKTKGEEGSVTNSLTMLTAIPEVDLGMDNRLKNIEETEKAKRTVDENRQQRKKVKTDEEHLVAQRFYRPGYRTKSDAEILRDAKREAMGLPPEEESPRRTNYERNQMATDEIVMERFKKHVRMG